MTAPNEYHFDADARTRALTPPTLTVGGFLFHGQLLSIVPWLRYLERVDELNARRRENANATSPHEWLALYRDFLRAVFPARTRRFMFRALDPVALLERQPDPTALTQSFNYFFALQLRAAEMLEAQPSETPNPQPTRGSTSSGSAAPPSDGALASIGSG